MPLWFIYSITATLFYGVLNFLYKIAAEYKLVTQGVVLVSAASVVLCSLTVLILKDHNLSLFVSALPFALFNGTFFALGALSKFKALKRAPAAVVFPVNKSNVVFVIIIGVVFFRETPSPEQWAGAALSVFVLIILSMEHVKGVNKTPMAGIGFALLAAVCTSLSMTAGKLASTQTDKIIYIFISYSIVTGISFLLYKTRIPPEQRKKTFKTPKIFIIGGSIGVLNFFGYTFVLKAFAEGSMALVQPIFALSILIPVFLSAVIYKEKLTPLRIAAVSLSLIAIILIKSG